MSNLDKGWTLLSDARGAEVIPVADEKPHSLGMDCECGPRQDGRVIIHNAHDRREEIERKVAVN